MKRVPLRVHLFFIVTLSALLIALFVNTQSFDTDEPARLHRLLDQLERFDAEVEQGMLQVYSQSKFDFDQLSLETQQMRNVFDELVDEMYGRDGFSEYMNALKYSVEVQNEAVDEFKRVFPILSSSIRYLPVLVSHIVVEHPEVEIMLLNLIKDILSWRLFPTGGSDVDRIRQQSERLKAQGFDKLDQHIQIVLTYNLQAFSAIDKAIHCGINDNTRAFNHAYDQYFSAKAEQYRKNNLWLVVLTMFLLGYLLLLIVFWQYDSRKLAASEKRFQLLFDLIPDAVGVHQDGKWIYCNPAAVKLFGATSEKDFIGSAVLERVHPDMREEVAQRIREEMVEGTPAPLMLQKNIRFDGSEFYGEVQGVPFDDGSGGRAVMAVLRDVTEKVLAEQGKAEQQEKMEHVQRLESLGILAGGIAHDFNNILTAIMGNAALAGRNLGSTSPARGFLSQIESSTHRASDLCKQMLAYSGKGKFVIKLVNLSELVEEMTRLMEVSIQKGVVIKYHLAENLPLVEVDSAQIQQVILNLITNANEAIGSKSGVISFSTGVMHADDNYLEQTVTGEKITEGRYVYIEVSDTGCGMDSETIQRIFDPFFTTKFTGRGLGMSAVLGIVRGHSGALKVYSEVGRGTTFKVLLPASSEMVEQHADQVMIQDQWNPIGTILVVDDEETIREVASIMLEDIGFKTLGAENGVAALDVYRRNQHDIVGVLMDMTMPKMDGKACFRELRRINPNIKVILSSGYNEQEATSQFVGQGLAGFIQKPYAPEALETIMKEIVQDSDNAVVD